MKKKFKAKVSGMFDIVQLSDDTFSEVVEKLKANDYHIDQQFTNREECYVEAIGDRFKTVKNVYGTLYTVREIKNGKILVDSDVTSMSVIKNFDKVFLLPISE